MTPDWVACVRCGATSWNAPPHGQGQTCPQTHVVDAAYVAKLEAEQEAAEAQRDYWVRAGLSGLDQSEAMSEITKAFRSFRQDVVGDDEP